MLGIVRAVLVAALQVIALAVLVPVIVVSLTVAAKLMSIIMAGAGASPRRLEFRKARAPGVQVGKQWGKLRARLFAKDMSRTAPPLEAITIVITADARQFDHAGKRYEIVAMQGPVHEVNTAGVLEADAVEI